jgi:hypothetical protein
MPWEYEIAHRDPLNKRWHAFCELANGLRDRIILTDGDDTNAPAYTKHDETTTKEPIIADFTGHHQRARLLEDNVDLFRGAIMEANGNDVCGVVFADSEFSSAYQSIGTVLTAGTYGSSWKPHSEINMPDYWAQMFEAMEKLRYCVWYLRFPSDFGTIDVEDYEFANISSLARGVSPPGGYACDVFDPTANQGSVSEAFDDYVTKIPAPTVFSTSDTDPGETAIEVYAGLAIRSHPGLCAMVSIMGDIFIANNGQTLSPSLLMMSGRPYVDYSTIFDKFFDSVNGTISASGTSVYTYGSGSRGINPFSPNGLTINTVVENDHVSASVEKSSIDPEYLSADLEGAKITFGTLSIANITESSQYSIADINDEFFGIYINAIPALGEVVDDGDISIDDRNYYFSDLASELDYI